MTAPAAESGPLAALDPRSSLRARATSAVAAGGLLLTAALTFTVRQQTQQRVEASLAASFETLAVQVTDKIDRTIYERRRLLQITSSFDAVRLPALAVADRRRVLDTVQENTPDLAWVGLVDAEGNVVAAAQRHLEGTSVVRKGWFQAAKEQPFIGGLREAPELTRANLEEGADGPTRYIDLAVPVFGANGQTQGVLGAQLGWNWAREIERSVIADAARKAKIGVTLYAGPSEVLLDSGVSGWTQPPDAPALPDERSLRGSLTEDTAGGTRYFTAYARSRGFRDYRGLGWVACVRQPWHLAFAPVESATQATLAWTLLVTVAATVATWIAVGRHVRRLRVIAAAAARIGHGDVLTTMPPAHGDDELEHMTTAVGRMTDALRAQIPAPPTDHGTPVELRRADYARPAADDPRRVTW
jgi:HAMP domain-containing protein